MSVYINERTRINDIIEQIVSSTYNTDSGDAGAIFFFLGDNKITYRLRDDSATSEKTIDINEEDSNPATAIYDATEQLSTAECKYDRAWNAGRFRRAIDTTREDTVLASTNTNRNKTFETLLVNSTDAGSFSVSIMDESFEIRPKFKIRTFLQNTELEIGQNINATINRIDKVWFGTVKCEIMKHQIDMNKWNIQMLLRYIEDVEA